MNYSECVKNPDFMDRFRYLKLGGVIGEETFGFNRWLNQEFYHSDAWKSFRRQIIIRDSGCDLACPGFEVHDKLLIHHIEPITIADIKNRNPLVLDPENVICVSHRTHEAIHYGSEDLLRDFFVVERRPGDTKLW